MVMEDNKMSKDNRTADKIQAIWNILGGERGVDALIRGELIVSVPKKDLKALTTIKLNTGLKTKADFLEALEKVGCVVNYNSMIAFESLNFVEFVRQCLVDKNREEEVEVVTATIEDISFKDSVSTCSNLERFIKPQGLYLCSVESVFQFVLQYGDKIKNNEWFMVGMNPFVDSSNIYRVFSIRRSFKGVLSISLESYTHHNFFKCGHPFIFLRPKPFCV